MKKSYSTQIGRAVRFKCNTSEKMHHQGKLQIIILHYDWLN